MVNRESVDFDHIVSRIEWLTELTDESYAQESRAVRRDVCENFVVEVALAVALRDAIDTANRVRRFRLKDREEVVKRHRLLLDERLHRLREVIVASERPSGNEVDPPETLLRKSERRLRRSKSVGAEHPPHPHSG